MCCANWWTTIGALLAGLGVVMGAFGAHGLDRVMVDQYRDAEPKTIGGFEVPASYKYLEDYKTGATYQMYHALGLLAVGVLAQSRPRRSLQVAGISFVLGIVLFSGSLYLLSLAGPRWLGVPWGLVTPFGGVAFIVGWIALAIGACPCGPTRTNM
jgi:uncharacterized membrane protein YgdD (TMEM256/DUF423 family)